MQKRLNLTFYWFCPSFFINSRPQHFYLTKIHLECATLCSFWLLQGFQGLILKGGGQAPFLSKILLFLSIYECVEFCYYVNIHVLLRMPCKWQCFTVA